MTFLLQDIRRALVAGEEVSPLPGFDERLQRFHPSEQADEVVLAAEREHGVNEVVADAGFALLDFEAIGEKFNQLIGCRNNTFSEYLSRILFVKCRF